MEKVATIQPSELAEIIKCNSEKVLIVDARTFCEFNTSHIINSVNVWSSKIRKKRLQQNSITVQDFLHQASHMGLQDDSLEETIVYDQSATDPSAVPKDSFLHVLLTKLASSFNKVYLLKGGFLEFQSQFYEMCEDSSQKNFLLTSFSQPCLPISSSGPTKILPFLFLGSQQDANNKQLLLEHNISYELNVSTTCPKPEFMQDSHFLRIPVNDNFSAKLLPHFEDAFSFIDKVRQMSGRVLVHCLAGISRSPTVVISYVMKYLRLHYDEAYRYVKTRRPTISPNINFVGQLLELDLHLFGGRVLFRSSPGSVSLDCGIGSGGDLALHSTNTGTSIRLKSSSSSCLKSCCNEPESDFPYHLNRSMPSLRLNKSVDEIACPRLPRVKYVSSRLPSSPVSRPASPPTPDSPEFVMSVSCPVGDSVFFRTKNKTEVEPDFRDAGTSSGACVTPTPPASTKGRVRVLERGSYVEEEAPPDMKKLSDKDSALPKEYDVVPSIKVVVEREGVQGPPPLQETKRDKEVFSFPPKAQQRSGNPPHPLRRAEPVHQQLPRSYSSSETYLNTRCRLERQAASVGVGKNQARKSFSSDEVGRGFQGAGVPSEGRTPGQTIVPGSVCMKDHVTYTTPLELSRTDSWSTSGLGSEISDWDSLQGDPTQPGAICDHFLGGGSSIDDAHGPFDAVFSEVYPGEGQSSTFFKETGKRHCSSACDRNLSTKMEENVCRREIPISVEVAEEVTSAKDSPAEEETTSSGACPTPRPVSLPGVSGTYKLSDSSANADMGVELDSADWQKEMDPFDFSPYSSGVGTSPLPRKGPMLKQKRLEIVEVGDSPPGKIGDPIGEPRRTPGQVKAPTAVEHPPVSPRTMGDNVKYIMTWYKIDSGPQDSSPSSPAQTSPKNGVKWAKERLSPSLTDHTEIQISEGDAGDKTVTSPTEDDGMNLLRGGEEGSLHERWEWWDNEFKKKIRNIKKNVSLTHWDPSAEDWEEGKEGGATERVAGYHLAQELMQSMEDLLDKEISDIKRQASALSSRFGLPGTRGVTPPKTDVSSPDIRTDWPLKNSPFLKTETRFCPSDDLDRQESYSLPFEFTGDSDAGFGVTLGAGVRPFVSLRAKSEPPLGDECLYRVKSCPGITDVNGGAPNPPLLEADMDNPFMLGPYHPHKNESNKRYSCSALDFSPRIRPSFESCPDMSQLRAPAGNGARSIAGGGSPSSSFTRLLRVS